MRKAILFFVRLFYARKRAGKLIAVIIMNMEYVSNTFMIVTHTELPQQLEEDKDYTPWCLKFKCIHVPVKEEGCKNRN